MAQRPQRADPGLGACTLNVGRGGLTPARLGAVLNWAEGSPFHVFFLQECRGTESPFHTARKQHSAELSWRGHWFFEPGTAHSKGCLMLLKPTPHLQNPVQVACPHPEARGRVLRVDAMLAGRPTSLVCVYAPAEPAQRPLFYAQVLPECLPAPDERLVLMGGDFNCITAVHDYCQPWAQRAEQRVAEAGAERLRQLMAGEGEAPRLVDSWRRLHPQRVDVTHHSAARHTGARLDRWLLSPELDAWVVEAEVQPLRPVATDHMPTSVLLRPPAQVKLGPGLPRLSPLACDEPETRDQVRLQLLAARERLQAGRGPDDQPGAWRMALWLRTKQQVLRLVRDREWQQRHEAEQQRRDREAAAQAARAHWLAAMANRQAGQGDVEAAGLLADAAADAVVRRHGAVGAQRLDTCALLGHVYWGPTYWFHSRAKPTQLPTCVRQLRPAPEAPPISLDNRAGATAALAVFTQHYSGAQPGGVFAARPRSAEARRQMLTALDKQLSPLQALEAEGPGGAGELHEVELTRAMRAQARGKAPGIDGLPVEFYATFWQEVLPLLHAAVTEAFRSGRPDALAALLTGVLTLVPKSGKPADVVEGYRPITLLPVDARIVARAIADRLHVPLDFLVSALQSAFIAGRDISDAIHYHWCLSEYVRARQPALYALLLDLAGAYDNVDWQLLQDTMRSMGFREGGHVRWARLLHCGATGCVLLNGHLGPEFPIHSGLLQGSGVSPLYWCIVLQPLDAQLRSLAAAGRVLTPIVPCSTSAQGPLALQPSAPMQSHADDIVAWALTPACVTTIAGPDGCGMLAAAGGPSLSASKSIIQVLGAPAAVAAVILAAAAVAQAAQQQPGDVEPGPQPEAQQMEAAIAAVTAGLQGPGGLPFAPLHRTVRYLGTPTGPLLPRVAIQAAAFDHQPNAIAAAAGRWRVLDLGIISRAHVAMQCLAAKLVFQLAYVQPQPPQLSAMQQAIRRFVAAEPWGGEGGGGKLHPSEAACAMPGGEGGLGYPSLDAFSIAMQAKLVAQLVGPRCRSWQPIMRSLLADQASGLASWVVTAPTAVRLPPGLDRLQQHVDAFSRLGIDRVMTPAAQSFFSVMAEPLLHNPMVAPELQQLLLGGPGLAGILVHAEVQAWRYVRDVRATLWAPRDGPPPLAVLTAVEVALACLPAEWAAKVRQAEPPPAPWMVAELPAQPGQQPVQVVQRLGAEGLQWVTPSGCLQPLRPEDWEAWGWQQHLPLGDLRWRPAHVIGLPKEENRLSWEELLAHQGGGQRQGGQRQGEQRQGEQQRRWPMEYWLIGPWEHVWLDPEVWGWDMGQQRINLAAYTVKAARLRLTQGAWEAAESARQDAGVRYQAGRGVWPATWGRRPAEGPNPQYDNEALQRVEARQRAAFEERQQREEEAARVAAGGRPQGEHAAEELAEWARDPDYRPPARRPPADRGRAAVARGQAAGPREGPQLGGGQGGGDQGGGGQGGGGEGQPAPVRSTGAWRALRHPALWEAHRAVAWKALHGALMVGAYRLRTDDRLPSTAACCAACAAAGRPNELDTMKHAFVECPAVQPALEWVRGVYSALAGEPAPPADPLVVVCAAPWVWQPAQPTLWLHLRVAFLGCVWAARGRGEVTAQGIVEAVVESLQRGLERDWRRVGGKVKAAAIGVVPLVWFRGRPPELSMAAFTARWPRAGGWYEGVPGVGQPVVRLSAAWPVALQQPEGQQPVLDLRP